MNTPYPYRLNAILFMIPLGVLGILFFVLPKQQVSEIEKRELAPMPSFSAEKLFAGGYTDSLDLHFSDNFPFRERWVAVAKFIENHRGFANEDVKFYAEGVDMDAGIDAIAAANDSLQGDSLQLVGGDSLPKTAVPIIYLKMRASPLMYSALAEVYLSMKAWRYRCLAVAETPLSFGPEW